MPRYALIGQLDRQITQPLTPALATTRPSGVSILPGFGALDAYLTGLTPTGARAEVALASLAAPFRAMNDFYLRVWYPRVLANTRPDIPRLLPIVSGYRSFAQQAGIVSSFLRSSGANLRDVNQVRAALRESLLTRSIPGFSRHHWGTEIDVVRASRAAWTPGGPLAPLAAFTRQQAPRFGFWTPYWDGRFPEPARAHYEDEPWHLSYEPASRGLREEWLRRMQGDKLARLLAHGARMIAGPIGANPEILYEALQGLDLPSYVSNVAPFPSRVTTPFQASALDQRLIRA